MTVPDMCKSTPLQFLGDIVPLLERTSCSVTMSGSVDAIASATDLMRFGAPSWRTFQESRYTLEPWVERGLAPHHGFQNGPRATASLYGRHPSLGGSTDQPE